jgi:hypothetical protein
VNGKILLISFLVIAAAIAILVWSVYLR